MIVQYTPRRAEGCAKFPNQIRKYRLEAGLSQRRLGEIMGAGRTLISAWERGRCLPTLPNAFRLAHSLSTLVEGLYLDLWSSRKDADDSVTS